MTFHCDNLWKGIVYGSLAVVINVVFGDCGMCRYVVSSSCRCTHSLCWPTCLSHYSTATASHLLTSGSTLCSIRTSAVDAAIITIMVHTGGKKSRKVGNLKLVISRL